MIDAKKLNTTPSGRRLVLLRTQSGLKQELGCLFVFDRERKIYEAYTLQKSGILPDGTYSIEPYFSPKHGQMVLILGLAPDFKIGDHSFIEIHPGNSVDDTAGCILPGKEFRDITGDGLLDVTFSVPKMNELLALIDRPTIITVKTLL